MILVSMRIKNERSSNQFWRRKICRVKTEVGGG